MHTTEYISTGIAVAVMVLAYACVNFLKKDKQPDDRFKKADAKLLPPDEFCRKVLKAKPGRMIILHIGDACATPGKGRRYEFRAEEPKSGRAFRTYFDDATNGSGQPVHRPVSKNMRTAIGHIQLLMQAASWHVDKRKGTLANPAFYLSP
jgi:hypothetical protein